MLGSRITLTLTAMVCSGLATFAWIGETRPNIAFVASGGVSLQSVLLVAASFFFSGLWFLTFCRTPGSSYFASSRMMLSIYAMVLGVIAAICIVRFGVVQIVDFNTLPLWQAGAYIGGATGCALVWFSTYFKTRDLVRRERDT